MKVFSLVDGGKIERRVETSRKIQTERACVCEWIVLLVNRLALWWKTRKMLRGAPIHERNGDPDQLIVLLVMNILFMVFCRWNLEPFLLFLALATIKHTLFLIMLFLTTYPDRIFWMAWLLASLQERGSPLLEAVDRGMLHSNYLIARKYMTRETGKCRLPSHGLVCSRTPRHHRVEFLPNNATFCPHPPLALFGVSLSPKQIFDFLWVTYGDKNSPLHFIMNSCFLENPPLYACCIAFTILLMGEFLWQDMIFKISLWTLWGKR